MPPIDDDTIIREAVLAALSVLDSHFPDGALTRGSLGDILASSLHDKIKTYVRLYRSRDV